MNNASVHKKEFTVNDLLMIFANQSEIKIYTTDENQPCIELWHGKDLGLDNSVFRIPAEIRLMTVKFIYALDSRLEIHVC